MRTAFLVLCAVVIPTLAGCSKSPEEASIDTLDEISEVLGSIKTKADAQKVKSKLGDLFKELEGYGKALKDKGPELMNSETGKKLLQKSFEVLGKMGGLPPEAVAVLQDEFKRFGGR